jgi:hypothetical protein
MIDSDGGPVKRVPKIVAVAAAGLIATGGWTAPAQAAPASTAAACPNAPQGGASEPTPSLVIKSPKAAVHNGPAAACRTTDYVPFGTTVYKWCSWFNAATGNWWDYTNWGWIYDGYLDGYLTDYCGD